MRAQSDNATATQPRAPGRNVSAVTLGEGHARPSKKAVSPAAPTNIGKLMDTLSGVMSGCNVLLHVTLTVQIN